MLFIDNKYTKWYYDLVNKAKNRHLLVYTENHHIIPRALGGSNKKNNIIQLTAREHYICHLLLTKMTTGNGRYKMIFALHMLSNVKNIGEGRYIPKSKLYEYARKMYKEALDNFWTDDRRAEHATLIKSMGSNHTEESIAAIIQYQKNEKVWTEKALKNRLNNCLKAAQDRKGKPWGEKRALTGYVRPSDEVMTEANKKRSEKLLGRRTSKGRTGQKFPEENKLTCEYCKKKLIPGYYHRYHGDNCKYKK